MIPLLREKSVLMAEVCRRFGVARLEVFGSAAADDAKSFEPGRSDIDFLVEFQQGVDLGPWMGRYFDLRDELARVVGRPVDLVMVAALRNPYFIREVNRTRELLYAA